MTTLCLHTAQFPYGQGEQFLETEIKYLVQAFDQVVILPASNIGESRNLPKGVKVLLPSNEPYTSRKGLSKIGFWWLLCLKDFIKSKNKILFMSSLLRINHKSESFFKLLFKNNLIHDTLHYTYWFNEQSTVLSILVSKGRLAGFISRAHGFDLYNERQKDGYIPFRNLQLKYVTKLFLISKNGLDYMIKRFPGNKGKYELSYLGVDNSNPELSLDHQSSDFKIISCSRVVDIKRVDLIAKALSKIKDKSIIWIHFGDGPLLESLKKLTASILPKNVRVEFKGHVSNQQILNYYKNSHIDCFINVSLSEGLPVSIMEAISNSIPIVATDVGGTSEIVTEATGLLIDIGCNPKDISLAVEDVLNNKSRNREYRRGIYEFWKQNFDASKNYKEFSQRINEFDF